MDGLNVLRPNVDVDPAVGQRCRREEFTARNALTLEIDVCLLNFLLELHSLKSFLAEAAALRQRFCSNVEVDDEVGQNQASVSAQAPLKV